MVTTKSKKSGATGTAGFEFLTNYMKAHPNAVYAEARDAAARAGHTIFPIVWGRAQAILGRVKSKPRKARGAQMSEGSAAGAAAANGAPKRRGRPPGSKNKPTAAVPVAGAPRRGRPPGSKNKSQAVHAATRRGVVPLSISDPTQLARWSAIVDAINAGAKAALKFDGSWSLTVE